MNEKSAFKSFVDTLAKMFRINRSDNELIFSMQTFNKI